MSICSSLAHKAKQALAGAVFIGIASGASAVTVSSVGDSFDVYFNGIINGNVQPGLTGEAHFTLTNIVGHGNGGENWDFSVILVNTSSSPITDSRISVLGFNTNPNVDTTESSAIGIFNTVGNGNLAQVGNIEVCFKDGGSGSNCSGGGNGGVQQGTGSQFFTRLNFNSDLSSLTLDNFAIRYQSISGSTLGDSGAGTEVPIPAPALLLGSALASLALKRRKAA